jgi:hypothetical protein
MREGPPRAELPRRQSHLYLDGAAVGSVAQAPADRDRDHLRWEPEPGERPTAAGVQRQLEADAPTQFLSQARQPPPRSTHATDPDYAHTAALASHCGRAFRECRRGL